MTLMRSNGNLKKIHFSSGSSISHYIFFILNIDLGTPFVIHSYNQCRV